jgi:hypothetical protein
MSTCICTACRPDLRRKFKVTLRWLREGESLTWGYETYDKALTAFLMHHRRKGASIIELVCPGDH